MGDEKSEGSKAKAQPTGSPKEKESKGAVPKGDPIAGPSTMGAKSSGQSKAQTQAPEPAATEAGAFTDLIAPAQGMLAAKTQRAFLVNLLWFTKEFIEAWFAFNDKYVTGNNGHPTYVHPDDLKQADLLRSAIQRQCLVSEGHPQLIEGPPSGGHAARSRNLRFERRPVVFP